MGGVEPIEECLLLGYACANMYRLYCEYSCANINEFITRPTVCVIMYSRYCFAVQIPYPLLKTDNFGCLFFCFVCMPFNDAEYTTCVVCVFCVVCFCKRACTQSTQTTTCGYPSAISRIIIMIKPMAKAMVPMSECLPCWVSGISSSTTT